MFRSRWIITEGKVRRSSIFSRRTFQVAKLVGAIHTTWDMSDTNASPETEKASIDEAFIDFTRPVREIILERFPYLASIPPDDGIDTPLPPPPPISWDGLGAVVPISTVLEGSDDQPESSTKNNDLEEEVPERGDQFTSWHDVALSIAAELMEKIRNDVRNKLGYTTSAVSPMSR
jgi:DNA polymerase eta